MNISLSSALKRASVALAAVILGCGPSDGVKEFEQGQAAFELRDLKKAEKLTEKSLLCAPQDVDRLVFLARVKLELGDLPAAKELVKKAAALEKKATDVILLTAQIDWHLKDYKAAAAGFRSLAVQENVPAEIRAQSWAGLGIVEMTRNETHLACVAFLHALRLNRRHASAWYHLGLLYRDDFGYLERALEHFECFVRLETSASPRVQKVQRAVIPALKESIMRSLSDRPGASKRDSAASAAALAKAEAAWKKGNFKAARQFYQTAATADVLSYPAALGLARAWLKTTPTRDGQLAALENYKNACALRSSAVSTFLDTGALASRVGSHALAATAYSRALAANPTSLEALDGLIRSLRKTSPRQVAAAAAYQGYRDALVAKRKTKK